MNSIRWQDVVLFLIMACVSWQCSDNYFDLRDRIRDVDDKVYALMILDKKDIYIPLHLSTP